MSFKINDMDLFGSEKFQYFCLLLLRSIFGIKVRLGGRWKDGGRDGVYDGCIQIPETETKYCGSWCIQVKFHDKKQLTEKNRYTKIIQDLRNEYKMHKKYGHTYDSYLFVTNLEFSWARGGSFDKSKELVKAFEEIGFKTLLIFDYIEIRSLYFFAEPKIKLYFDKDFWQKETSSKCNNLQKKDFIISVVCKFIENSIFSGNYEQNPLLNPEISWIFRDKKFYLYVLRRHEEVLHLIKFEGSILPHEILVIQTNDEFMEILRANLSFLPIQMNSSRSKIENMLKNYQNYLYVPVV